MPSQKNVTIFEEAKQKLEGVEAVFFVNYQGLTHKQLEEARKLFKEADSEVAIIKNNLVNLAIKEKMSLEIKEKLFGPYAVIFSYKDPVKTAKVLSDFFKKYNLPEIKFGVFENQIIEKDTILKLASIPPREVLLAKMVGNLKSPISGLVYSLNYNLSKLVYALKEIEKKKPSN